LTAQVLARKLGSMAFFLELILSWILSEEAAKRHWVLTITMVFVVVGFVGAAGQAGLIPIDLAPLRDQLGFWGEQLVHWGVLIALPVIWLVLLMPLGLYFRLRDASVGKPD
jgi:hypothetical protein